MSAAIGIPSSGYWPIGSSTRLSGLSRSDFVHWPIASFRRHAHFGRFLSEADITRQAKPQDQSKMTQRRQWCLHSSRTPPPDA